MTLRIKHQTTGNTSELIGCLRALRSGSSDASSALRPTILLVVLYFASWSLPAQALDFRAIEAEAGRPYSEVTALLLDQYDYLWVGGEYGEICRYDGLIFECWDEADGLPPGRVNDIYQTSLGEVWTATETGLAKWDGRNWHRLSAGRSPARHLLATASGHNEQLVVVRERGLLVLHGGQLRALHPELMEQRVSCVFAEEGQQLVATEEGVYRIGDDLRNYPLDGLPDGRIEAMARFDVNHILLAIERVGLVSLNERTGRLRILNPHRRLHRPVDLIADDELGYFWLSTQGDGLIRLNAEAEIEERYGPTQGINSTLGPLALDRWGQLWLGGDDLLLRARPASLRRVGPNTGLPAGRIFALANDTTGTLGYAAVGNRGMFRRTGETWSRLELGQGFDQTRITALTLDTNNRLWVGDWSGRLMLVKGDTLRTEIPISDREMLGQINQIIPTPDGGAWLAGNGGLGRLTIDTSGGYTVSFRPDLPEVGVSAIQLGPRQELWVGQANGNVIRIDSSDEATYFDPLNDLPAGTITDLAFDRFGRLWVISLAGPRWADLNADTLRWRPLPLEFREASTDFHQLLPTPEGLWLGTGRSLQLLRWNSKGEWGEREIYGPEKGWLATPSSAEAVAEYKGSRFFPTTTGLIEFQAMDKRTNPSPPEPFFNEVSLFYEPLSREQKMRMSSDFHNCPNFGPGQNHFSFEFGNVDLRRPRDIYYRYQLRNIDTTWSPPTQNTNVSYAGLPPGHYGFDVQAKSGEGLWGNRNSLEFIILPPWWKRGWTPYLLILLLCTSAGGILYAFVARIKRREAKRRLALETQNQVLTLEQQALQLQMNPHFIFNVLGGIRSLIGPGEDPALARSELQRFARMMRGILHNSRQEKISLAEEIAVLEDYLQTERTVQKHPFDFQIEVDPEVDPEELDIPPMLLQPFVENAILHGIAPLDGGGLIRVCFSRNGDLLDCRIIDNGIGREAAARLRKAQRPGHRSVAVEVNRRRLELLRGKRNYPPLLIRDGLGPNGQKLGTEVVIHIPDAFPW